MAVHLKYAVVMQEHVQVVWHCSRNAPLSITASFQTTSRAAMRYRKLEPALSDCSMPTRVSVRQVELDSGNQWHSRAANESEGLTSKSTLGQIRMEHRSYRHLALRDHLS